MQFIYHIKSGQSQEPEKEKADMIKYVNRAYKIVCNNCLSYLLNQAKIIVKDDFGQNCGQLREGYEPKANPNIKEIFLILIHPVILQR